jgi:hypothetical protein
VRLLEAENATAEARRADEVEVHNSVFVATARLKLEILSKYILPLLYGLLGAFAFVLRDIAREVQAETYSRSADVGYTLRIFLGLVAGLSVAWFIQPPGTGSVLATISPLALSFVAGYSVDLLFTAMDRIVGAFSSRTGAQVPAAPAK